MTDADPFVWIYIASNGAIHGYDTEAQAITAAADDPGDAWIERVQVTTGPQAPEQDENAPTVTQPRKTPQTGAHGIHIPTGTGMTAWYRPWDDGGAA